jgi:adrenodoxin-NADP+ reductase
VELRFLMNPIRLESSDSDGGRIGRVVCERTSLVGDPFDQKIIGTSATESMPADLVLISIGYMGMPLEGMEDDRLFDDTRGVVANVNGKVVGENNLFVTGWIKRGPTGIIGTNISDAKETVASVMEYIESGGVVGSRDDKRLQRGASSAGRAGLVEILHGRTAYISWSQYLKINAAETDRGGLRNDAQPREKLLTVDGMLAAATQAKY